MRLTVPTENELEVYSVEIYRSSRTGVAVLESWYDANHYPHRIDGPAKIARHPDTGIVTHELWVRNNQPHRDEGPASIQRDPTTGNVISEEWYRNGKKVAKPRAPQRTEQRSTRRPAKRSPEPTQS